MNKFVVVIPARYASQRLPGKPLRIIAGKPMLQHVYENATLSGAADVIIATDDERIVDAATEFDAETCMTSPDHKSGTDRIFEAFRKINLKGVDYILNLQGDEPILNSNDIVK